MPSRTPLVLAAAVLSVLAVTASLPPQPPQAARPEQQRPPTFRTEANFVRVDVFAMAKGSPVKDLKAEDFRVLEDGVEQTVSTFEHVEVRTGTPQEQRAEPNTIRESREALKNPRARVFVLFLDVPHVSVDGAWHAREPLIRLVDRLMGPEDLVGIMMPRMSAADVVFARKTQVIEGGLRNRWPWGERHTLDRDQQEIVYEMCFPYAKDVATEMMARKRERETLESLYELVSWLRIEREERKAILTVTEGWLLYGPSADLTRLRVIDPSTGETEAVPGPDPIHVGPDGRITRTGRYSNTGVTKSVCDAERVRLANIDDALYFNDLIAEANRSNASFYTIDPRGLAVFDSPVDPDVAPSVDMNRLRSRHDSLQVLANNTDGFAVLNSNDLDKGLRRISDDLTSYYLLGYYSTNTKLDGRFRNLKVTIRRPGIDVRARRGYKAATAAEVNAARVAAAAPVPESLSSARDAMSGLSRIRSGAALSTHAVALRNTGTMVWVAGELTPPAPAATSGILTVSTLGATSSAEVQIAPGQRGFVAAVPLKVAASGPVDIRVRISTGEGQPPMTDAIRIDAATGLSTPLMFRRGQGTGNRMEPAGQPQFSRTERARFEVPMGAETTVAAGRVLDRNGTATQLSVSVGERTDAAGQRWATADVVLAALAPADYLIELSGSANGTEQKVLTAFRVTR